MGAADDPSLLLALPQSILPPPPPPPAWMHKPAKISANFSRSHRVHHGDAAQRKTASALLFCFSVIHPSPAQLELASNLLPQLRACDGHAVYSNGSYPIGGASGETTVPYVFGAMQLQVKMTVFGPMANNNTQLFMPFYRRFVQKVPYWDYSWIVKLDSDAVFFPDRLRARLRELPASVASRPTILSSPCPPTFDIKWSNGCVYGGMMVSSSSLVQGYANYYNICEARVETNEWDVAEDGYWHRCAHLVIGAREHLVLGLLYAEIRPFRTGWWSNPTGDVCKYFYASRANAWMAAFHSFKTVDEQLQCRWRAERPLSHVVVSALVLAICLAGLLYLGIRRCALWRRARQPGSSMFDAGRNGGRSAAT